MVASCVGVEQTIGKTSNSCLDYLDFSWLTKSREGKYRQGTCEIKSIKLVIGSPTAMRRGYSW